MTSSNSIYAFSFLRIFEEYRKQLDKDAGDTLDEFNETMNDHFLKLGNAIRIRSNTRYLMGLAANGNDTLIAYFNNQLFHTAPLSLNQVYNSLLVAKAGACSGSISTKNWPLPFSPEARVKMAFRYTGLGNQLSTNVTFAMAFIIAFHVMFYIQERVSKMKMLQFIAGVNAAIFWAISFLFDFTLYLVTSLICYITIAAFGEENWSTAAELSPLFLVLLLFGLSSLAITLVASYAFTHASHGFVTLTSLFIITGNV